MRWMPSMIGLRNSSCSDEFIIISRSLGGLLLERIYLPKKEEVVIINHHSAFK
jgi:hypothetical protein